MKMKSNLRISVPDLNKNGTVKTATIGYIDTPEGKIKLTTCYRDGKPSFDITDIDFEITRGRVSDDEYYHSDICLFYSRIITGDNEKYYKSNYTNLLDLFHEDDDFIEFLERTKENG